MGGVSSGCLTSIFERPSLRTRGSGELESNAREDKDARPVEVFGKHCGASDRPVASHQDEDLARTERRPQLHVESRPARLLLWVLLEVPLEHPKHLAGVEEGRVERSVAVGQGDGEDEELWRGQRE